MNERKGDLLSEELEIALPNEALSPNRQTDSGEIPLSAY